MADWSGNSKTTFVTLGASNHSAHDREINDYYATLPDAAEWLCELEELNHRIWEPACGEGHLPEVFKKNGHDVLSTDLIDRGYGDGTLDFLQCDEGFDGDIVTNPPYKYAQEFIEHALDLVPDGNKVIMFLKLTFLESSKRKTLFDKRMLKTVWVSRARIPCALNGNFKDANGKVASSAVAYGWYVFEKGFSGNPEIKWFN